MLGLWIVSPSGMTKGSVPTFATQATSAGYPAEWEIASILAEKCGLVVASSTLVRFVAVRSKVKRKQPKHHETRKAASAVRADIGVNINPTVSDDDLRKRIELLKQRPAKTAKTLKQFEYDPDQPLQLPYKE